MKPRIQIEYDIEENGANVKRALPFAVGIIGDFIGNASPYSTTPFEDRSFIPINKNNINTVMQQLKPTIKLNIESSIFDTGRELIELTFNSMEDFKPNAIIQQVPALKKLWELRRALKQLQIQNLSLNEQEKAMQALISQFQQEENHAN
jgi:type VI secretion system protein ImpB